MCLHVFVVISCPDLVAPQNGTKNTNETDCGTTVEFSCDECYELKGHKQLSCLPNRTWSGEEPNCSCQCLISSFFQSVFSAENFVCLRVS